MKDALRGSAAVADGTDPQESKIFIDPGLVQPRQADGLKTLVDDRAPGAHELGGEDTDLAQHAEPAVPAEGVVAMGGRASRQRQRTPR